MQDKNYDVIIVGAGPAGWGAAVYSARAGLKTVVFGLLAQSNLYKAHVVENYFGFPSISGPNLMEEGKKQALRFGAEFVEREIIDLKRSDDGASAQRCRSGGTPILKQGGERETERASGRIRLMTASSLSLSLASVSEGQAYKIAVTDTDQNHYTAKAIIICSGLGFKPSGIKNEQQLIGKGVSFCATCDGFFFKGKNIAVIGHGHFAGEEALALLTYTPNISLLSHGKEFSFSEKIQEGLRRGGIKLIKTPRIKEFVGAPKLEKLKFADETEMPFDGVFLALGIATAGDFANKLGILRTGPQNAFLVADSRTGKTNVPGVYAAGDCTGGNAQAAKSTGEGCNAAMSVIKELKGVAAYVDYS